MTPDQVRTLLDTNGYTIKSEQQLAQGGVQLRTNEGPIVNVFDTGTVQCQGRNKVELEALLHGQAAAAGTPAKKRAGAPVDVFVVYGHNDLAKTQTEAMLRRWGLKPILLDQIPAEGYTLIEKLEKYINVAPFAVVLATADDVYLTDTGDKEFRARQNVVLELGMMLAHLGRQNVAILLEDKVGMKKPSDIDGLEYIGFGDSVKDADVNLAKMMANRGYNIDVKNL